MHPAISEFPSKEFYKGKLQDGVTAEDRPAASGFPWPDPNKPVAFIPVSTGKEVTSSDGTSKQNAEEAAVVVKLVDQFLDSGMGAQDIGIISPYNGQVRLLKSTFEKNGGMNKGQRYHKLVIHSVDGFQGTITIYTKD
jgi:regulator of nonsense transcripts 1